MGIVIRKYPDLTQPVFHYNGTVRRVFSPSKWTHLILKDDGTLEKLDGVTTCLKRAVDKSLPLMAWAKKLAFNIARRKILELGLGPDGAIQLFVEELDRILAEAKAADSDALETAGEVGHSAHEWIERLILAIMANDERRVLETLAYFPEDERAESCCVAAIMWMVAHKVKWLKTEFTALSLEHHCCGTGDGLALVSSCDDRDCCPEPFVDRLSLTDWKSSNYLYATYLWQTAFYSAAHEEEFKNYEYGQIQDRWVLRLDKETGEFDPWHAPGREAQAEDLHGFLCCLNLCRALDATEKRIASMLEVKRETRAAKKALDKLARDRVECPKAKDYQGVRLTKCLPDGNQCDTCNKKYLDKHPVKV
jgi:hypothetical protein